MQNIVEIAGQAGNDDIVTRAWRPSPPVKPGVCQKIPLRAV